MRRGEAKIEKRRGFWASVRSSAFSRTLKRFVRDDDGQAIVEYILLLSVVLVGAATIARAVMKGLDQGILRLGGQLEKDLKTGRGALNDWRN